jgi:hypothetical protein
VVLVSINGGTVAKPGKIDFQQPNPGKPEPYGRSPKSKSACKDAEMQSYRKVFSLAFLSKKA